MADETHKDDPEDLEPTELPPTATSPPSGEARVQIGPYRLLEKVGEGGMGEVYKAEQTHPIRRLVALKVIQAGMDTKQVVARFEAERQALAMMDHPAVAKVFDAGATSRGRPYFAMEYVKGVPITEHCDRHRLTTRERLDLFMQVCEGVQHAHQKAIIHRDLKPSNVLVALRDGKPEPKIIDFGVAKAIAHKLTEGTMFTELGVLVGTPEYMSPEQAEMTGQEIDTRADVYSLGVMLYELLSGGLPLDSNELRNAGLDGIRRKIREVEPPKPSTRLNSLGDERSTEIARRRRVDLPSLHRQLSGDLDWITMKALEKDLGRRYGSPQELATDIRRYLEDEPVLASPPSTVYRARKFVRRHPVGVAVTTTSALVLLAFAVTMTIQAGRIAAERELYLEQLVVNAVIESLSGNLNAAETVIRQADELGIDHGRIRMLQGQVALQRGQPIEAIEHLEHATELLPDNVAAQGMLAQAWDAQGSWAPYFRELSVLDTMTPVTFHDYLAKGAAESKMVPGQGMDLLDEAVRIRPGNAVARLIRAEAGWRQAVHTSDQDDVERALDDAHFAKELLPENSVALVAHLKVQLTAYFYYKANGQLSKSEAAIDMARTDAEALEKFDDRPHAYLARANFFTAAGRPHEALEEMRRGVQSIKGNLYLYMGYGFFLARLGEYEEAYEHMPILYNWFGMFFLADLPDGRARARDYIDDKLATVPPIHNLISQVSLRLLGAKDEAVEVSRTLRRQLLSAELPDYLREWYQPRFDFACDYLTEEEYLETAGDHRDALAQAHYYIGMNRLAAGNPTGAREHFQKSVEAMPLAMGIETEALLAKIFLAHLEREPDWTPSKSLPDDEAVDAFGSQAPDSDQDE